MHLDFNLLSQRHLLHLKFQFKLKISIIDLITSGGIHINDHIYDQMHVPTMHCRLLQLTTAV